MNVPPPQQPDDSDTAVQRAIIAGARSRAFRMAFEPAAPAPQPFVEIVTIPALAVPAPEASAIAFAGADPRPLMPGPDPAVPRQRSWLSRRGRHLLRLFRPIATPWFRLLEARVRTAVDTTSLASAVAGISVQVGDLQAHMNTLRAGEVVQLRQALADAAELDNARSRSDGRRVALLSAEISQLRGLLVASFSQFGQQLAAAEQRGVHQVAQLDHANLCLSTLMERSAETAKRLDDVAVLATQLMARGALRLPGDDYLIRCPYGWLVAPGDDERLLMALHESGGLLEPGTTAVVVALLRAGDRMVDVGAHIGTLTLPAARAVSPGGMVIAIEPGQRARALLQRCLHVNSVADVVVVHGKAAGAAAGEGLLTGGAVLGEHTLVAPEGGGSVVSAVTISSLDDMVPLGPIRLLKIDVEGMELEVWRGARRIVRDNPELAVIVEFGPSHLGRAGITVANWVGEFTEAGFTVWEIDEAGGLLRAGRPVEALEKVFSMNILLLRQSPDRYGLRVAA